MSEKKKEESGAAAFRFLSQKEFAALTTQERIKYLELALEAIKSGHPLDQLPIKDRH
jgi:hypothetical protein